MESAHYAAVSYLAAQAGESALESEFARYYRPLWEQYHLLFMADGPGLLPGIKDTLSYYEEPQKAGSAQGMNLYGFHSENIVLTEANTAVDQGGAPFLKAVLADMEFHGMTGIAETFLSQTELVKEAETVSSYIGSLSEYEGTVSEIEKNCGMMEEQGLQLKKAYDRLGASIEEGTLTEETGRELLEESRILAAEALRQTEECYGRILEGSEELKGSLMKAETELSEKKGTVSQASYEQMEAEFENLEEYTREDGSRRLEAASERERLEECAGALLGGKAWEDGTASGAFRESVRKGREMLDVFEDSRTETKGKNSLLDTVKAWKNEGILGLVIGDVQNISDRMLPEGDKPSGSLREENGEETFEKEVSAMEKGAAILYAVSHFGRYGEERKDSSLAYEVEYVLGGLESDKENLTAAVEKIMAVRSGMNFLYLLSDMEKQAEAEAVAVALAGFTGIYPLVKFIKGILLGAWAFAEAICDLRVLLDGGQIPLIKTRQNWKLSLSGAKDAVSYRTEEEGGTGIWDYKGYLCILLLMGNTKTQCFRMMDLIEINLRKKDSGFFMENCLSYALVEFEFWEEPRFFPLALPGLAPKGGYLLKKKAAYGYYE